MAMVEVGESPPRRGPSRRGLIARYILYVSGFVLALVAYAYVNPIAVVTWLLGATAAVTAVMVLILAYKRKGGAKTR